MSEPHLAELLERLRTGPLTSFLRDRDRYDRDLWRDLAESDDPLLREMGTQLRDGTATPLELLRSTAYAPVFQRGLDRLAAIDPASLAADLDRATEVLGSRPGSR